MTNPDALVEVSQEAREAAAALIAAKPIVENPDIIIHGGADDGGFAQAFARFEAEVIERAAGVADRIATARRHAQRGNFGNRTCLDEAEGASAIATAIRALSQEGTG